MHKTFKILLAGAILVAAVSTLSLINRDFPPQITVAEKVQGSAVRINCFSNYFLTHIGSGTILRIKGDEAVILTAAHLITDDHDKYTVSYAIIFNGGILEFNELAAEVLAIDYENDLALIIMKCDEKFINKRFIGGKIYSGERKDLFNKDCFIASYVHGYGPIFSRGYINMTGYRDIIGVYGDSVDLGSSGSAVRDAKTGDIICVISTTLGDIQNRVLGEMNCVPYNKINKFLIDNNIILE